MINLLAVSTAVLSLVTSPVAADHMSDVPPGAVTISVDSINGTGCPYGSVAIAMKDDKGSFSVSYSEYTALAGPGVPPAAGRKSCQINMRVNVPDGYTYGIPSVDYTGYADVKRGAHGSIGATHYFSDLDETPITQRVQGPMEHTWQQREGVPYEKISWNPCGNPRQFHIKNHMELNKGNSTEQSTLSMDSPHASLKTVYHVAYKKC